MVAMAVMVAMQAAGVAMAVMVVMGVTQAAGGATVAGVIRYPGQDVMANDVKVKVEKVVMVRWLSISRGTALPEYRVQVLAGNRDVR